MNQCRTSLLHKQHKQRKWNVKLYLEPWCVEVSTVSTVSTECRGGVEGVSVDTSVDGVDGVEGVSKAILTSGML